MKNLKVILMTTLAVCCINQITAQAQSFPVNNGNQMPNNVAISIGGGYVTPSSATKDKAFLVNTPSISADAFIPVFRIKKGWDGYVKGIGLNVNATYLTGGSGEPTAPLPTGYAVTGATASTKAYRGDSPKAAGFIVAAGPQLNIGLGKHFLVSPILSAGYTSITQKAISAVQTTSYNGNNYDFNLTTLPETKISGFTLNPALRLQYKISPRFGLWFQGCYIMGPTVKTTTTSLIPNGPAQTPSNTYNLQQLQTGTYKTNETVSTKYNAVRFGGGVVFSLGRKGWDGYRNEQKSGVASAASAATAGRISNTTTIGKQTIAKKGWDGTVKGLFNVQNSDIIVSKNGGVEKLIAEINKQGKATATKETYENKDYLKVVTKKGEDYVSDFYLIQNSSNFTIIGEGKACIGRCATGCNLGTSCICYPVSDGVHNPLPFECKYYTIAPISNHLGSLLQPDLVISTTDNGTTLSSSSVKDIKDLIIAQMPNVTVDKVEIIKEKKDKFIKVALSENGNVSTLYTTIGSGHSWVLIGCTGTCDGDVVACTSKQVNILGGGCWCGEGKANTCYGFNVMVVGLNSQINIEK